MTKICQKYTKIKKKNIVSLCIMGFNQNNDSLMLMETCVAAINLFILYGFHVQQGDIYGSIYYLYFARISYPL
jgi:hypothetical protein